MGLRWREQRGVGAEETSERRVERRRACCSRESGSDPCFRDHENQRERETSQNIENIYMFGVCLVGLDSVLDLEYAVVSLNKNMSISDFYPIQTPQNKKFKP